MAINIPNDTIIVTPRDPNPIVDPVYTGVTGTLDPGTITVINFGDPTVNPLTGGGTTGVITPVLTTGQAVNIGILDPCNQPIILGRMINTVTTTGTTDTFAPYFNAVSSNVFDLSNITGYTANVVYKNAVVKPGYTIYFKDVYGNLNNGGPVLLPNSVDIITGATVYVNGVSIMNQDYRPFKVKYGIYLLTLLSADYTNNYFFYSLTGDIVPSTEKPIKQITQYDFVNITTESVNKYIYATLPLSNNQLFGTITYNVDLIILADGSAGGYFQKNNEVFEDWSNLSNESISNVYMLFLPSDLGELDAGLTFKFICKQSVLDYSTSRFVIGSDILIYNATQKTLDADLNCYVVTLNTAEMVEIYWDGYSYIVTNILRQPYINMSNSPLGLGGNNFIPENNINNLI